MSSFGPINLKMAATNAYYDGFILKYFPSKFVGQETNNTMDYLPRLQAFENWQSQ